MVHQNRNVATTTILLLSLLCFALARMQLRKLSTQAHIFETQASAKRAIEGDDLSPSNLTPDCVIGLYNFSADVNYQKAFIEYSSATQECIQKEFQAVKAGKALVANCDIHNPGLAAFEEDCIAAGGRLCKAQNKISFSALSFQIKTHECFPKNCTPADVGVIATAVQASCSSQYTDASCQLTLSCEAPSFSLSVLMIVAGACVTGVVILSVVGLGVYLIYKYKKNKELARYSELKVLEDESDSSTSDDEEL